MNEKRKEFIEAVQNADAVLGIVDTGNDTAISAIQGTGEQLLGLLRCLVGNLAITMEKDMGKVMATALLFQVLRDAVGEAFGFNDEDEEEDEEVEADGITV